MKLGFRKKIYLGFFALLLIQGFVMFFWVSQVMRESLLEEIKSHGHSIGVSLSARMVEPMLAMDFLRMKVLMDQTVQLDHDIFYSFILDVEDRPLIHTFKNGFPIELKKVNSVSDNQKGSIQLIDTGEYLIYDYAVPVFINKNRLGTIRLGLFQTRAQRASNKIIISAIVTIILTIIMAGIVGTLLLNPVTKSIKKLHDSSEKALRGDLDVRTAPSLKENCWDIMQCNLKECPAYENFHHRCWYMAGTLCPSCVHGEYAKKIDSCHQCQVYKSCSGDEIQSLAESFDAMTLSLNDNLYDLKSAEIVLNEQKALLQTILDAIPDFISLQDHEGRFISVNKAFCKMLGRDKEQIINKTNDDLFPGKLAQMYNQEDKNIFETGIALAKENKILGTKGVKWLHVVKIPVPATKEMGKGLVCSGRDITQLKDVQEQLTHAQKLESVGRLAAGVAHEINTPLGIILGYAQLLLEDMQRKEQGYEDVQTIVRQTKNCSKIVADLLKFSRSGKSIITRFDINEAVKEVLGVVEHTFSLNQVIVLHEYDKKIDLLMNGDKEKIKQVLINLLNNAFDAVKKNGSIVVETKSVKSVSEKTQKGIQITISDTGHGIDGADIDKIFEPFYTTKSPDKGTGLGLSVTFGIIKEHNGSIKVFSPPLSGKNRGQGTQFIIALPCDLNYT
ncbi:MAG: PAS domain S-box protein [Desulfobacula sp.]|nr:PAS domain S-box protein [Desulfobacula sp.]